MKLTKRRSTTEALKKAGFTPAEAASLSRNCSVVTIKKGDQLTKVGGYSRTVFLIVDGSVDVTKASGEPHSIAASYENPLVIGEISALMDRLYNVASVAASEDVHAVVMPSKKLARLMESSPRLSEIVQTQRQERLDEMHQERQVQRSSQHAAYEVYLSALSRTK